MTTENKKQKQKKQKEMKITKICCIGAGYVGGPTMALYAKMPAYKLRVGFK
jgi:UDPglucose 6-dehydrogenase